jgi:hypothetical protein
MLVGIKRHWRPVILQIKLERLEVAEGAFRAHEAQLHQLARRIVDEHQQRTRIAAILEPAMLGAIGIS